MAITGQLGKILGQLHQSQIDLLVEMARAMTVPIKHQINSKSDIVTEEFAQNFANRLLMHHAVSEEKFNKKSFEYAFYAASKAAGRRAALTISSTNPGADIWVDDIAFSLKTEASKSISAQRLTISKLMEARWIRNCSSSEDFAKCTQSHVGMHLKQYQRIIVLRAFDVPPDHIKYELTEIPVSVLRQIDTLRPQDFAPRTENGTSRATVIIDGHEAFTLRLDGSVEKITIAGLRLDLCLSHGSWLVPSLKI